MHFVLHRCHPVSTLEAPDVTFPTQTALCFKKKFTLLLFAITKSDVDRFQ